MKINCTEYFTCRTIERWRWQIFGCAFKAVLSIEDTLTISPTVVSAILFSIEIIFSVFLLMTSYLRNRCCFEGKSFIVLICIRFNRISIRLTNSNWISSVRLISKHSLCKRFWQKCLIKYEWEHYGSLKTTLFDNEKRQATDIWLNYVFFTNWVLFMRQQFWYFN